MKVIDRISAEARAFSLRRALLILPAGLFYGSGRIVAALWLILAWCLTAIRLGWQDGKKTKKPVKR